eukprot:141589-Pyramimonas_sp.AAC.1
MLRTQCPGVTGAPGAACRTWRASHAQHPGADSTFCAPGVPEAHVGRLAGCAASGARAWHACCAWSTLHTLAHGAPPGAAAPKAPGTQAGPRGFQRGRGRCPCRVPRGAG